MAYPYDKVATLDQNLRVETGSDVTRAKAQTGAKLGGGGQGIHLLYTEQGNYRVEAPINKGLSIMSAEQKTSERRNSSHVLVS